jgi:ribosomal protein S18 acetylase RimI-like enzyme
LKNRLFNHQSEIINCEEGGCVIHYRTFRNTDPPGLVAAWNAAFTGRGAVRLHGCLWPELFLFSKPYFDPESVVIAQADQQTVGFAWTGFGPNDSESALESQNGILCLLGVAPSHRRQGIGSELLGRAEAYLCSRGSNQLFAGSMYPLNPYTFGLYGGSNSSGFLESDLLAGPFLASHGYSAENSCLVFQRSLKSALNVADGRFAAHRLRYHINSAPLQRRTWWQECVLGPIELYEYRLQDKLTGRSVASAFLWEMETYVSNWNEHAIGITDIIVADEMRRQGLAKFLMVQTLRFLQDQFYGMVEMQVHADNVAAINLLRSLGFEPIDAGHVYRKSL